MPREKKSVTKPYTLEQFMKSLTNLRVSEDVYEDLIRTLDELVTQITKLSGKLAREDHSRTIMPHHVDKATEEVLRKGTLTIEELREKIKPLSAIELSQLTDEIDKMAQELLKPKRPPTRKP